MKTLNAKFAGMRFRVAARNLFRAARGESGAALIMAMLFMIVIVILVTGVTIMTTSDFARVAKYENSRRAFYITEAGIEQAKFLLNGSSFDEYLLGPDGTSGTTADNGLIHDGAGNLLGTEVTIGGIKYSQVAYDGGTYNVRVFDNEDELTNDPYTDSDNIIVLESIGIAGDGSQKRIIAAYRKVEFDVTMPSAVAMVGPAADLNTGGNIRVSGGDTYGWDIHGFGVHTGSAANKEPEPDTDCPNMNAITMEDSTWTYAANSADWDGNSEDAFNGKTNPSTVNDGVPDYGAGETIFTSADAELMRNALMEQCDNCTTGMAQGPTGSVLNTNATYGTVGNPEISYFDGNVKFTGGAGGVGVLIIDGNLDINSTFDFAGIILIGACSTCWGEVKGVGDANILGALIVGNALDADATFSGTAAFWYSCQAIQLAQTAIGNQSVADVGWHESD